MLVVWIKCALSLTRCQRHCGLLSAFWMLYLSKCCRRQGGLLSGFPNSLFCKALSKTWQTTLVLSTIFERVVEGIHCSPLLAFSILTSKRNVKSMICCRWLSQCVDNLMRYRKHGGCWCFFFNALFYRTCRKQGGLLLAFFPFVSFLKHCQRHDGPPWIFERLSVFQRVVEAWLISFDNHNTLSLSLSLSSVGVGVGSYI